MKTIFLLAFLIISLNNASAQNFAWAQSWGSSTWDYGKSVATDGNGNIFAAGLFGLSMDADPGPGVVNLVSSGERDIFISKFNSSGKLLWAKKISGVLDENVNEITTDADGNLYLTGTYNGMTDFNPGPAIYHLETVTIVNSFICKLDNDGNFIWAKGFNSGASTPYDIAVDANQNVYTIGRFNALTDFDPGPGDYSLEADLYPDMFICRLDAGGELVWAKQIAENGDTAQIRPVAIAVDLSGNVCATGTFEGTVDFDPGPGVFNLVAPGEQSDVSFPRNCFVSKLDPDGNFVWAGNIGVEAQIESTDIAVDEDDNIYVAGYFLETADFDPGPGIFEMTSNAAGANSYICKLDDQGGFIWAKAFSGSYAVLAYGMKLDQNNIYTTGFFNGAIDFDPGAGINYLSPSGGADIFVSKLDLDGNFVWAQKAGGAADEEALDIAVDPVSGSVYTTGFFTGATDFDPSAESWEVSLAGERDVFLVKLSDCLPVNGITESVEICNHYTWPENGGFYTASGTYYNTLTSSTGCDSTVKLDLTLTNFENELSYNAIDGYITADANEFIDEYQWINCETFAVVGTQGAYHVTALGSYALISTSGDCIDTTDCIEVTVILGIDEAESGGFSLYPNPVSGHLVFQSVNTIQPFEVEITSVNGQVVYHGTHSSGDHLATSEWQSGIYTVKIISGEKWYVKRIVKD